MHLAKLLTPEHVVPTMRADDHWPAIVELVDHIDRRDLLYPENRETILTALKHREEFISTGVGAGIAIPHAFSDVLTQPITVFGRSMGGINFDALDDAPVHFVVLFLVPRQENHHHLQTLATIARMFADTEICEALRTARDTPEILAALNRRPTRT